MQPSIKKALVIAVLTLPVFLVLGYFGMLSMAPESSAGELGPVILDTEGEGYRHGDVVWLTKADDARPDDIILYDWMKANPMGMGPRYALRRFGDLTRTEQSFLFAKVCCKLGHNTSRGIELKTRVY